ncbi:sensor histidine kinase [Acidovorax temperans]|uniref:sensor histidine kinase n=1 Tax=Acidovorax temperans TaxID=80878 RepID=UPI0035AF961D
MAETSSIRATTSSHWDAARFEPSWLQFKVVLGVALLSALLLLRQTRNTFVELMGETTFVAITLLFLFNAAAAWRQSWVPRWFAQLVALALGAVLAPLVVQLLGTGGDIAAFTRSRAHVGGYFMVMFGALIMGSLVAVGAYYREQEERTRAEALQFALERETLQRQAADARLQLLTAQIEPHFLLNTLANVKALVDTGSPRASPVFASLIDYLRAAMQQINNAHNTLADEIRLVRAYLDIMVMRMPDRLQYQVEMEPALASLPLPPMSLLTLVENAIRHGIDPGIDGGTITVGARRMPEQVVNLWVSDTGVGMSESAGSGKGLNNLLQRLHAFYGEDARLELSETTPHGLRADLFFRSP